MLLSQGAPAAMATPFSQPLRVLSPGLHPLEPDKNTAEPDLATSLHLAKHTPFPSKKNMVHLALTWEALGSFELCSITPIKCMSETHSWWVRFLLSKINGFQFQVGRHL